MREKKVTYKLVQRKNPQKRNEPKKWYAQTVGTARMSFGELARQIEKETTVSTADTTAVLTALTDVCLRALRQGQIVSIGNLGSLRVIVASRGAESEKDFTNSLLKPLRIRFRPSVELKRATLSAEVVRTSDKDKDKDKDKKKGKDDGKVNDKDKVNDKVNDKDKGKEDNKPAKPDDNESEF